VVFPFAIDRHSRTPLALQLANRLRHAIRLGVYRPGDRLPTYGEMADALGVSLRAPREAVAVLVREGLVRTQARAGCEVISSGEPLSCERILIIVPADAATSYFAATMVAALRRALSSSRRRVQAVTYDRNAAGRLDYAALDEALREGADFAVVVHGTRAALVRVRASGILFCCFDSDSHEEFGSRFEISLSFAEAMAALSDRFRRQGVRRILLCDYRPYPTIRRRLERDGFEVDCLRITWMTGDGYLERIERDALERVGAWLKSHWANLPDALFFTDDFVARGGLLALVAAGSRVTRRMRVVTLANRGYAPVAPFPLARVEADPVVAGQRIAESVKQALKGDFVREVKLPLWLVGEEL